MALNEGRVYFALDGDNFTPDEVTRVLGISPTKIALKGSRVSGRLPKYTTWSLSTENIENEYIDVYEMASSIIEQLEPKKEEIVKLIKKLNLRPRLEVVLTFSMNEEHSTPAIGFEASTVKFLADVGAFIDVDTYKN